MAAQGYPGAYEKGSVIRGLDLAGGNSDDVKIFHAGTKKGPGGEILASGGRVLDVTAMASTIEQAQALARSEEHTSELQSLMRISYAVFCLKKKNKRTKVTTKHEN